MSVKVLLPEDAAALCDCSPATLERYRKDGTGPNFIRTPGGHIKYLAEDVEEWLRSLRQQPTESQRMQAAATHGLKEVGAACRERVKEMQALDRENGSADPYAVTVSDVGGATPGIEKLTYQNGQWVKNGTLVQPVVESQAAPHILQGR